VNARLALAQEVQVGPVQIQDLHRMAQSMGWLFDCRLVSLTLLPRHYSGSACSPLCRRSRITTQITRMPAMPGQGHKDRTQQSPAGSTQAAPAKLQTCSTPPVEGGRRKSKSI